MAGKGARHRNETPIAGLCEGSNHKCPLAFAFVLYFVFFFSSALAQEKPSSSHSASHTLIPEKVVSWQATDPPSLYASYADFFADGDKQFLVWENNPQKSIDFYDWEKGRLAFALSIPKTALKKNDQMHGFYVLSPDSLYILDANNSKLHLLNQKGRLIKSLSLQIGEGKAGKVEQLMARIYSGNAGIRKDDWLYIGGLPLSGASDPATFSKGKTSLAINLETGEVRSEGTYPSLYSDGSYSKYFLDVNRCLTPDGQFLYSFGAEDSVRLRDLQQPDKTFYAGSSYFESPPPAVPELGNTGKPQSYGGILYDPKQQVYYRMAHHGLPDVFNAEWGFDEQELSIIILDRDFRKIGEKLLPKGKHNFRQWFIGPDGLYISNLHPSQEEAHKQEISFTHYKLVPADSEGGD